MSFSFHHKNTGLLWQHIILRWYCYSAIDIGLCVVNTVSLTSYTLITVILFKGHLWIPIKSCELFETVSSVTILITMSVHSFLSYGKMSLSLLEVAFPGIWMYHDRCQYGIVSIFVVTIVLNKYVTEDSGTPGAGLLQCCRSYILNDPTGWNCTNKQ